MNRRTLIRDDRYGLYRLGGAAFAVSGVLFFSRAILEAKAGPPPSSGEAILAWVESEKLVLSFVSEVLFFATVALVPAVAALYHSLASTDRAKAVTGCGVIAVAIPILAMSLIAHGRLIYPIYSIRASSPALAEFSVAIYYGGMHAVLLMFAGATLVLSVAMIRGIYGRPIAYLGFATSVLDVAGAYPDRIGPVATFVCQVFLAAWFVVVGSRLLAHATSIGVSSKAAPKIPNASPGAIDRP